MKKEHQEQYKKIRKHKCISPIQNVIFPHFHTIIIHLLIIIEVKLRNVWFIYSTYILVVTMGNLSPKLKNKKTPTLAY